MSVWYHPKLDRLQLVGWHEMSYIDPVMLMDFYVAIEANGWIYIGEFD